MRRPRGLSEEERALWDVVASSTRRLSETAPVPLPDEGAREPARPPRIPAPQAPIYHPSSPERAPSAALRALGPVSGGSGLDKRTEARLRKGQRAPDARLDLHGMTARRAHMVLLRFIEDSRAAGLRMVLVITGKGASDDFLAYGSDAPGVLRREVPVWLSTSPLAGKIVNVSRAHPRHGGDGALYVYLKRSRAG